MARIPRRTFLAGIALPIARLPDAQWSIGTRPKLAWSPATPLGLNMIYTAFWGFPAGQVPLPAPNQYATLRKFGVSFIRATINYYLPGGGVQRGAVPATLADFAERKILSVRPFAQDPTQLELTCNGATYTIPSGEHIILSTPLQYTDGNGVNVSWPAQKPIPVTGGTKGALASNYNSLAPSTIHISAGRKLVDAGPRGAHDAMLLHANFFAGGTRLRSQIAAYVTAVEAWMNQGFCLDHSGPHEQLDTLNSRYGQHNIDAIREQEWHFFATRGWSPAHVLVCNSNEILWDYSKKISGLDRWKHGYSSYLRYVYARLRHHFPAHTLGFGAGNGDTCSNLSTIDWWPNDSNTQLIVHGYPDDGGWFPVKVDGLNMNTINDVMDIVKKTQERLNIPQVYWQEFGNKKNHPLHNLKLSNMRSAILSRGWFAAPWGADIDGDYYRVALKKGGLWQPAPDSLGAFGLN